MNKGYMVKYTDYAGDGFLCGGSIGFRSSRRQAMELAEASGHRHTYVVRMGGRKRLWDV